MALCDRVLNFDLTPEQGSPAGQQKDKHARSKSMAEINQIKDEAFVFERDRSVDRQGAGAANLGSGSTSIVNLCSDCRMKKQRRAHA